MENDKIISLFKELISEIVKETIKDTINEIVKDSLQEANNQEPKKQENHLIYGIMGLANFLGVSMTTAQKFKNERLFPCIQHGRTLIFKSEEVLAGLSKRNNPYRPKL